MLTALRHSIRYECSTRKDVVRVLSKVLRAFSAHCEVSILATKTSAYGMTECVGSKRSEALQLLNDEYVVMRTTEGCDLSLIGLSCGEDTIEITSNTVDSQQKKGYNSLLRAAAVMIAYVEKKPLRSEIANAWSAYALLKSFQVTFIRPDGNKIVYSAPLTKEEAMEAKRDSNKGKIFVRPTIVNLDLATELFTRGVQALKCARA